MTLVSIHLKHPVPDKVASYSHHFPRICLRSLLVNLCALFLLIPFLPPSALAGDVTLSWAPPTTYEDGTPLPLTDILGYHVYYGTTTGIYCPSNLPTSLPKCPTDAGKTTTYTFAGLPDGTYCFIVTALDTAGDESNPSNEVCKTIQSVPQYTLTVGKTGTGSGTVAGTGISCGSDCSETRAASSVMTLSATPDSNSTFTGWFGGGCAGNGMCSFTLSANTAVTASFSLNTNSTNTYTITASAGTGGTITPSGAVSVNQGATQSFTIAPNSGYRIADVKVDGASVGAVSSYTFNAVSASHTIESSYAVNTSLTALPNIYVSPASYNFGYVYTGFSKKNKSFTIKNTGTSSLIVTRAEIVGDTTSFSTNFSSTKTIAPSGTYNLTVTFRPKYRGQKTATLRISSNDPDTPVVNIPLTGAGR